jgi:phosphatidylserine decarboxylase
MTIHKEGRNSIIVSFVFALTASILAYKFININIVAHVISALMLLFWFFVISFFRIPSREPVISENHILCPADGTIVVVEEILETEYFNDKRLQISIFMSPLNVHANWYPLSGVVKYVKYHAGKHMVASHPKSSTENERTTVVVENIKGQEVLFRQIAGTVARRIVCYSQIGDKATQGENYGFIKFGSRVDVILPLTAKTDLKLNDKVQGLLTVLATMS